jgi:MauM/NapG family ferredoxin protein
MAKSDDSSAHTRRSFFREALSRLAQPVAEYVDAQIGVYIPTEKALLRPPGALLEDEFLDTCVRSGACVNSCPAQAILPIHRHDPDRAGTPYIDPDYQPCVVCETLECMNVCPSGALLKLAVNEIQIGLAVVNYESCLRTESINCRDCVDSCPIGNEAIRIDAQDRIEVMSPGCVGCGVCQYHCPTSPKSIRVEPIPV